MSDCVTGIFDELFRRYPVLEGCRADILTAYERIRDAYEGGGMLFCCGNGGSASDALHIAGELMKGFVRPRPIGTALADALTAVDPVRGKALADRLQGALPCVALGNSGALATAYANDVGDGAKLALAEELFGLGCTGDVLLCISTSGNSENILYAATLARARDITVISLTGEGGGELAGLSDVSVRVPETETYRAQELHLPVYHAICLALEANFFGE